MECDAVTSPTGGWGLEEWEECYSAGLGSAPWLVRPIFQAMSPDPSYGNVRRCEI